MEQTFAANGIQRIVLIDIWNDVSVRGWGEQNIKLEADGHVESVQPEGDTLTIRGSSDDLELWVPYESSIRINNAHGDTLVSDVQRVELRQVGGDVEITKIHAEALLEHVEGDLEVSEVHGDVTLREVQGDVEIHNVATLRAEGAIQGSLECEIARLVELQEVQGDVELRAVGEVSARHCAGDFSATGIDGALRLADVGGDLVVRGFLSLQANNVGGDILTEGNGEVTVGNVGGDLEAKGASQLQVGNVSGDCALRGISGEAKLGMIGADLDAVGVTGELAFSEVGGDATLKAIQGSVKAGNIGGDLTLQANFPPDSVTQLHVGGDAAITLPSQPDLTLRAFVGGDISGRAVVASRAGNQVNLVYGNGSAHLDLHVGGDLRLRGNEDPRSSSSAAGAWDWNNFSSEMARMGQELGHDISRMVNDALAQTNEEQVRRARNFAEKQERMAERMSRRVSRQAERVNIRINNREWHMDRGRLERIMDQARKATAEGVHGALDAVEQALRNLQIPVPPTPPTPPAPPTPPHAPVPPVPPVVPVPPAPPRSHLEDLEAEEPDLEHLEDFEAPDERSMPEVPVAAGEVEEEEKVGTPKAPVNVEQERLAILRMIAEGRVSPEEGDMLLEALGE
ncbi:hypothetical protein KSC_054910 [Ktedonobacter sp. SOSP1-52]|uniref:SHOCT-like domain-containing protein n=1 Tax=Ktedonobacter sp. SOSP1-52 TaxID=2778366 RepID=UPI00191578DB|nr:hypothetical protein [Ktedonobacter sp. SOSP1-52]GHO66599.1 hypothetical protein KSC_054910 [Ktedonobacter sp. SOSP1-52]